MISRRGLLLRAVALARIAVGLYFAKEAITKVSAGWLTGGSAFSRTVRAYPSAHGTGFYHNVVTGIILPHAGVFAFLVTLGECAATVSLVLGIMTRFGALIAIWLNLNFMLLRGLTNPSGALDKAFVVAEVAFFILAAGHTWGLDGLFAAAFSRNRLLRWCAGADRS